MELDMTKGSPLKLIVKFMIPLIIGNIFQQFYNMADTIIVGRCIDVNALAAVGATGTIIFLILGTIQGLTAGFTVLAAQRFGAGDREGVKKSVGNAIVLSLIVTIIGTVVSVKGMDGLLRIMNTPPDIFEDAKTYITIICVGLFGIVLYNMSAGVLRAVGNSKAPLYFLIISALLNIVLDLVFIAVFGMGVAGAAWATVISQTVSGILCIWYIAKKVFVLHIKWEHLKLDYDVAKNEIGIAIPMAIQFAVTAVGAIIVQSVLNMLGSLAVAAYTAAGKVEQLMSQPFLAIGVTMATYAAQNKGINDYKRIRAGVKYSNIIAAIYAVISFVVLNLTIPYILRLFVSGDITDILGYAKTYILVCSAFFYPLAMIFLYRNTLQASGYSIIPMLGGVVELVCRVVIAYIAAKHRSFTGVCFANGATWLITGIFLWIAYVFIMRAAERKQFS